MNKLTHPSMNKDINININIHQLLSLLIYQSNVLQNVLIKIFTRKQHTDECIDNMKINNICVYVSKNKQYIFITKDQQIYHLLCALTNLTIHNNNNIHTNNIHTNKIANIENIKQLYQYCNNKNCNIKDICKWLLIRNCDINSKRITYRSVQQIQNIILHTIYYIMHNTNGILIYYNNINIANKQYTYIQQLLNKLNINNIHNNNIDITYNKIDNRDKCIIYNKNNRILQQIISIIDIYKLNLLLINAYNTIIYNTNKQLCKIIKICAIANSIKKYINKYIKDIQNNNNKILHSKCINKYIQSYKQYNLYNKNINKQYNKCIYNKICTVLQCIQYNRNKRMYKINKIQNNIRMKLANIRIYKLLQQQYVQQHRNKYNSNIVEYGKIVDFINNGNNNSQYINGSIQCNVQILYIGSWNNCDIFRPQAIYKLFNNVLHNNSKHSNHNSNNNNKQNNKNHNKCNTNTNNNTNKIVKMDIKENIIQIIRSDGKMFKYGQAYSIQHNTNTTNNNMYNIENNSIKYSIHNICKSDDNRYELVKDENGYLYSRGENMYGQLGIGSICDSVRQWSRVKVKNKVKLYQCRAKKSMCLTIHNQLYIWGATTNHNNNDQHQQQYISVPKQVKTKLYNNTQIIQISCTYNGYYIILKNGQVYNIQNGKCIKRAYRKQYQYILMKSIGNANIEILYSVALNIDCYDSVKKNSIINWFRYNNNNKYIYKQNNINKNKNTTTTTNNNNSNIDNIKYNSNVGNRIQKQIQIQIYSKNEDNLLQQNNSSSKQNCNNMNMANSQLKMRNSKYVYSTKQQSITSRRSLTYNSNNNNIYNNDNDNEDDDIFI